MCSLIIQKLGSDTEIITGIRIADKIREYHADLLIRHNTSVSSLKIKLSPGMENDAGFRRHQTQRFIKQLLRKNTKIIQNYFLVSKGIYSILPECLKTENVRSITDIDAFLDELKEQS